MVVSINKIKFLLSFIFIVTIYANDNYIDVITTNDMHGFLNEQDAFFMNPNFPPKIIGGAAFIQYINEIKEKLTSVSNDMLILDGGNFFQGHPVGIVDSGRTIIEWMNKVGYDAIVPAQNDFLFGYENLIALSKQANFPFLAANIIDSSGNNIFDPYTILNIKNVNIGVIGIAGDVINESVLKQNIDGIKILSSVETMQNWVSQLKQMDVDIIVVLTSAGVPWDRDKVYNEFIANDKNKEDILNAIQLGYYAEDVDFIISGGISKGYRSPWYDKNSHTYIFQNYGNGTGFGHFKLKFDKEEKKFIGYESAVKNNISQTLSLDDFNYDQNAYHWIDEKYDNAMSIIYHETDWETTILSDSKGNHTGKSISDNWDFPNIDNEDKLDVITWNCEFFPTNNDLTIEALSEAVMDFYPDIIAFQEIKKRSWFSKLMEFLPDYNFVISQQSSFMDQAIIYKKELFDLVGRKELYAEDDYFFAGRPPLQCDFVVKTSGLELSIINLHMKCCDSGLSRRKKASEMIHKYVNNAMNYGNNNYIILGDWNDDLKDGKGDHCFDPFLNDERFFFPTLDITYDISQASYPKEPYISFLDHILVSKSLIPSNSYSVKTIPIDKYMGGFSVYEHYISDHMPVLLSF
tara:strand:- start:65 stop:1960 length:1896 start_codon:yes stop_codon:yes gene_type:complete